MMMLKKQPTRKELFERILGMDKVRKSSVERLEKEIDKLFKNYILRVKDVVNSTGLKAGKNTTLESTTKAMIQLSAILEESGFNDVIEKYLDEFHDLTKSAINYYSAFGAKPSLAGISTETLDAYIRFTETELRNLIPRKIIAPIESALLQVNMGNQSRTALYEQIDAMETGLSLNDIKIYVDDSFSSYQRAVLTESANALDLKIFAYLGPDDAITSDQCEAMLHVDKHGVDGMLYVDEITPALHPNLEKYGRNPLIGGGHPRCRHHWSPITLDYAKELGFEP